MEQKNSKLEQFRELVRNPFSWVVICGIIILVAIIITALAHIFRANPYGDETRIDNFGDYVKGMPIEKRDAVFNMLYTRISMENGGNVTNVPTSGALIREGTNNSTYDEKTTLHSGNFIVDIESIRQSYTIQYEWSDKADLDEESSYAVVITCPRSGQNIYPEFKCNSRNDTLSSTDSLAIIGNNTPYFGKTSDGFEYFVKLQYYNGGSPYAEVNANTCGNKTLLQTVGKSAREWMENLGINLEEIPIELRDLCDGGA